MFSPRRNSLTHTGPHMEDLGTAMGYNAQPTTKEVQERFDNSGWEERLSTACKQFNDDRYATKT